MSGDNEVISHTSTISGKLSQAVSDALAAAHGVPKAPASGMRPGHQQLINAMFADTRKTLLGVAATARTGVAAIAASDEADQNSGQGISATEQPQYT